MAEKSGEKKNRFNFVDAILLIAILAVVFFALYSGLRTFVFGAGKVNIIYVMETSDVAPEVPMTVVKGDGIYSFESGEKIGEVDAVSEKQNDNPDAPPVYYITVKAEGRSEENGYFIGQEKLNIGKNLTLKMKNLYCSARCVSIDIAE